LTYRAGYTSDSAFYAVRLGNIRRLANVYGGIAVNLRACEYRGAELGTYTNISRLIKLAKTGRA
jgi:hypothetical protein